MLASQLQITPARVAAVSIAFPLLRWILNEIVYKPAARRALSQQPKASSSYAGGTAQHPGVTSSAHAAASKGRSSRQDKLCESLWKLSVYSCFLAMGLYVTMSEGWWLDTTLFWRGWPDHEATPVMRLLYQLQLGHYASSIFTLLVWEERRKDIYAMLTHHVAATVLVASSVQLWYIRVGCAVMALHDFNDVLLEAAKICKYCGAQATSNGLFVAFVAAWVVLRLCCFPALIIRSTLLESVAVLGGRPPYYRLFNALLLLLYVLHLYWFTLIARVAREALATGRARDLREEDDDGDGGGRRKVAD